MNRERRIDRFVDSIAQVGPPNDRSENVYRCATRRENLTRWLTSFIDSPSSAIFVGEAPGFNGARITGVPFTSPAIITRRQPHLWGTFEPDGVYAIPEGENCAHKERAATLFWSRLSPNFTDLPRPLTWNAYPYWPTPEGASLNRSPNESELEIGQTWLREVAELHPQSLVVAIGNNAKKVLNAIGVECCHVRHPSFGGAPDFEKGVKRIAEKLRNRS